MTKTYRRLGCALLAVCCLGAGLGAAAADGSGPVPATLSYLRDTFLPDLEQNINARVQEDTKAVRDTALARVDEVGNRHAGTGWTLSQTPLPTAFKGGDTLTLDEGGSVLWQAGIATGTGLVDATAGAALPDGGTLTAGHRYLNGQEGAAAAITVDSDAAQAAPAGRWKNIAGGRDVTAFYDLPRTAWFYDGVRWAVGQDLFKGVSTTRFAPYGSTSRAMTVTLLHRVAGTPEAPFQGRFSDVPEGQWYTEAVEWAAANGILADSETFSPSRSAKREEIVTMLYRCCAYLGLDTSATTSLDPFPDNSSVSPYAQQAMSWAVATGIIQGSNGRLLPQSNVTRAQVALILQRFQSWRGLP